MNGNAWTKKETRLIGTRTDLAVADEITRRANALQAGYHPRTEEAVRRKRVELGIPAHAQHRLDWSKIDPHLGTASDAKIAKQFGTTRVTICNRRRRLGVPCSNPTNRPR